MASLARQGAEQQEIGPDGKLYLPVRQLALSLVKGLQQKDFRGEAKRLLDYVRERIRYVKDIDGVETLHDPVSLLHIGQGDCDDKATLLAALLLSIGHTPRFIAVAFDDDPQYGPVWAHVWVQDDPEQSGDWIDLEPTEDIPFGKSIPKSSIADSLIVPV